MAFRRWSKEEEKFLKENYCNITAKEIANKLRRSKMSVLSKAQEMHIFKESKRKREYATFAETVSRELKARVKMQEFKTTKKAGDKIKVKIKDKSTRNIRTLRGKVILKNNRFILIQTKNYRECVNLVDVYIGQAVIS